ncbi:MAG TPA: hypothetical protein VLL25_09330 [Acidimicrobiales bacterium]|nr:hypothetical protein [Acidimicrobiales bacterium]
MRKKPAQGDADSTTVKRARTRTPRWQQVNAEWAEYVASPAYQELRTKLRADELEPLRRLVHEHGAANAHVVITALSGDVDVDGLGKLIRRFGHQSVHNLIDDLDDKGQKPG